MIFPLKAFAVIGFLSQACALPNPVLTIPTITTKALAPRATASCSTATLVTPQPSGAICGPLANSDGSGYIVSYISGVYVSSVNTCAQLCLTTTGCTNLYFELNAYCNLHSGPATNAANTNSPFMFYNIACFACSSPTTTASSFISTTVSHVRGFTSNSQTATPTPTCTTAPITFQLSGAAADSSLGEIVHIAGSAPELGVWVFADSIAMSLIGSVWGTSVAFALGEYTEYKYYWVASSGTVVWSAEPNYVVVAPSACGVADMVMDVWR